jgi:hypothetical protein
MGIQLNTDAVFVAELLRDFAWRSRQECDKAFQEYRRFDRAARELESKIYPLIGAVDRCLDRGR